MVEPIHPPLSNIFTHLLVVRLGSTM
uniref:Uncharacterized protein n=1 Tax=Anguilla anguilla TaxID=7936 RepID=A0A0E9P7P3_ANGAN